MNDNYIYDKTERGATEVRERVLKLVPQLHSMLILINGKQPVSRLVSDAKLLGAPDDFLSQLSASNLIVLTSTSATAVPASTPQPSLAKSVQSDAFLQFRGAKDFMNISAVKAIGIRSLFFTLSLEKASSRDDLNALIPQYEKILRKGFGDAPAAHLSARAQELLV